MITGRLVVQTVSVTFLLAGLAACDGGKPSRTKDEIADDSTLAADLALANRDTLLVDSIGAMPPGMAEPLDSIPPLRDSAVASRPNVAPSSVTSPGTLEGSSRPVASPAPAPPPASNPTTPAKPAAALPAPKLSGLKACNSATLENQSECIRVSIATGDARLNRIYRALITEMRRQEGVAPGAKDPPSVQRLRVAQRAWLVYRDTECRRRGRGKEGALWAKPRSRCLAQFASKRANELADNFSRLTAH
jgi:uncharacterized protein YecT (DUF1311 family)